MPLATKSPTGELDSDTVLREEANTIHPAKPPIADSVKGAELYQALHGRNATALCLSGGGIRSASFALGVIEALAVHPRQATAEGEGEKQAASEKTSFLAQFHYLSTVSGGGYIGSWLSAWIARDSYSRVWSKLIGRRTHPDEEPGEIAWLRAYSNYLTPKLGLFSADTWTAVALYVRNLILNWLVILPAICLLLFTIKFTTVLAYWLSTKPDWQLALTVVAVLLMIWTLRFATRNRPTCNPLGAAAQPAADAQDAADKRTSDAHRNEMIRMAAGANQARFFWLCLMPAILASNIFAIYLSSRDFAIATKPVWYFLVAGILSGLVLYAVSWLTALPFKTAREKRGHVYWLRDLACWSIGGGGVYGALMGLGAYLFLSPDHDLKFLIGRPDVTEATANLLILAIYGVPWVINAQLTAEMVFVGLTSWQRGSDFDREWFGRSTGWFAAAAIVWFAVAFAILVGAELAWQYVVDNYAKYVTGGIGALSGILTAVFGAGKMSGGTEQKNAKASLTSKIVLTIAPALFLIILVIGLSLLIDYLLLGYALIESPLLGAGGDYHDDLKWLAIGCGAVLFVAFFSWTRVNINRFSMHALYRNRLVRAYLGASNPKRAPNPFTGFDEVDNYPMQKLWTKGKDGWQPFHVVNIALNVVASSRLAWQERKAEPFTATPLHCGTATFSGTTAHSLGYRRTGRLRQPYRRPDARHRARNLRRGRQPEHGLQLLADGHPAARVVQRAPWLVARQSRRARRGDLSDRRTARRDHAVRLRDVRADHRHAPLRLPVGWRTFRESRTLRDDPPPLPLHRGERRRMRSRLRLRGSRQRGAQDRNRPRRLHPVRHAERAQAALEGRLGGRQRLLCGRRDRLQDRAGMEIRRQSG